MLKNLLIVLTVVITSCDQPNKTTGVAVQNKEKFPIKELQIENSRDEGWGADIKMSIVSIAETDTSKLYTVQSTYEGKSLGLLVSIPKQKTESNGFGSGIVLKSIGNESDNFLMTLAKLYKQKTDSVLKFTKAVTLTFVDLDVFAKDLGAKEGGEYKTENQYKLFYESKDGENNAELYLNVNTQEHWIEFKEKDEEYRPVVIKFLKQ